MLKTIFGLLDQSKTVKFRIKWLGYSHDKLGNVQTSNIFRFSSLFTKKFWRWQERHLWYVKNTIGYLTYTRWVVGVDSVNLIKGYIKVRRKTTKNAVVNVAFFCFNTDIGTDKWRADIC